MSNPSSQSQDLAAWWGGSNPNIVDVTAEAYANAVQFFEKELLKGGKQAEWIRGHASINDVLEAVKQAQIRYDSRSEKSSKARKWVNSFASTVVQYGAVLDTLSQADPVHAGLAWGAMKFVLLGVLGHEKMLTDLCQALATIGEALPQAHLAGSLYNTPWMRNGISRLYAYILLFLQRAVEWYNGSRALRAVYSITRPLLFQDVLEEVKTCTDVVESIANALSRAEIRGLTIANRSFHGRFDGITLELQRQADRLKSTDRTLQDLRTNLDRVTTHIDDVLRQILLVATNTYDLSQSLKINANDSQLRTCSSQLTHVFDNLDPELEPGNALQICIAAVKRHPSHMYAGRDTAHIIQRIKSWAQSSHSSLCIVAVGPRGEERAKDLVLQVVQLLRLASYPVFWCFSGSPSNQTARSVADVIKTLIYQALQYDPSLLERVANIGNLDIIQRNQNAAELKDLAIRVFSNIRQCFVVVEMDDVYRTLGYQPAPIEWISVLFREIYTSVASSGNTLKLLLVSRGSLSSQQNGNLLSRFTVVNVGGPLPVATRRKAPPSFRLNLARGRGRLLPNQVVLR